MKKILSVFILAIFLTGMLPLTLNLKAVRALTITVPDDYPTIQEAIGAADVGDTIFVRNGTYYESVSIFKSLFLIGENRSTILHGTEEGTGLDIEASNVKVSGFTVRNFTTGFSISSGSDDMYNITIDDNRIEDCSVQGIWSGVSECDLQDVTIVNNTISSCGRGINFPDSYRFSTGRFRIINNVLTENEIGIRCSFCGPGLISDNFFFENGEGISITGPGELNVLGNLVFSSTSFGIFVSSGFYGGPIYNITHNLLWGNEAGLGFRRWAEFGGPANGSIWNNTITDNFNGVYFYGQLDPYEGFWDNHHINFYHNNLINNTRQAFLEPHLNVTDIEWNSEYPIGGNHWSDYFGSDFFNGPGQNETGSDGIGDTQYIIREKSTPQLDNYPLVEPNTLFHSAPPIPIPPVARFYSDIENPVVNDTLTFNGSSSCAFEGHITTYAWDFGDGDNTTEAASTIMHDYTLPGSYNVTLTVTDNTGLNDTILKTITVGKMSSTISIAATPSPITIRENTTINGTINPTRADTNVTIWYRHEEAPLSSTKSISFQSCFLDRCIVILILFHLLQCSSIFFCIIL